MNNRASVPHYHLCAVDDISAHFSPDRAHRFTLRVPLTDRSGLGTWGIIGQNPSIADERTADRTIRFLERYVCERLPQYGHLLFLNLYSRVDTNCVETEDLLRSDSERRLKESLDECADVLLVFGKLADGAAYRFLDRARQLSPLLESKRLFKFDIGATYPPHPGNPKIIYANFNVGLVPCDATGVTIAPS